MSKEETLVIEAALLWWRHNRPLGWRKAKHLECPEINCTGRPECRLARAVAKLLRSYEASKP